MDTKKVVKFDHFYDVTLITIMLFPNCKDTEYFWNGKKIVWKGALCCPAERRWERWLLLFCAAPMVL